MNCLKCDKPKDQQGNCNGCSTAIFANQPTDKNVNILLAKIRELAMDPLLQERAMGDEWDDATVDAYYRGQASGINGACLRIEEALAGHHHGAIADKRLQQLCDRIVLLRPLDSEHKAIK